MGSGTGNEGTWPDDPQNPQADTGDDNTDSPPVETLDSLDCLVTVKNGDMIWKSMPSIKGAEQIGHHGNEMISTKLKVDTATVSPLMLKYLKLEFHLYEADSSDTRIAEALVYFGQMQHITAADMSLDDTRKALKQHNAEAVARSGLIKVSLATSQVTLNTSTQQVFSLARFDTAKKIKNPTATTHGSRHHDFTTLKETLESQGIIEIDLLLKKPVIHSGEDLTEVLQRLFSLSHEADTSENPMNAWFPKSERSHDMPLGHVPRLDDNMPRGLPRQEPLVRFQHEDQYMVTQVVGAVNKALAEQAAAQDVVSTEFAANVIPLLSSNDDSQFIVIIKPKGHDIYLPTYGESCHIQIPKAKIKRSATPPDVAKVAKSILVPITDYADDDDGYFLTIIREALSIVMDSQHDEQAILSLRAADDEEPEIHAARIENFVRNNAEFLISKDAKPAIEDEPLWFPATRMDFRLPKVPADAQLYLASCPLQARDETAVDPDVRKPISVELPFVELDRSISIHDYMESVIADEQQKILKAFVKRTVSDRTIRAEVFAINALHNPESAKSNAAIGAHNVEAFKFIQGFQHGENTRSVNLHAMFPVLGDLSQRNDGSTLSKCPEQIKSQYEKLDAAKKVIISHLDNLPAGLAFIPGVAGSGKTELIKFIVAACTFGQGTAEPVPALCLAPNNQAVDDMAQTFQDYFEKLGLEGAPTILRLHGLDFEVRTVICILSRGNPYQYYDEEKAQTIIQEMEDPTDRKAQFLAAPGVEEMGIETNEQKMKRTRYTNVSAHTAAIAYYKAHIDKYSELRDILAISDRDGSLREDDLKMVRLFIKSVFHDMLRDFNGIICTTPVVAANETVRRFQAQLVFTDEAASQPEISSLIGIAHYNPCAWFYLGDPAQLKPHIGQEVKATDNPFIRQMSMSLLERAVLAGVELGWLDTTHRRKKGHKAGNCPNKPARLRK